MPFLLWFSCGTLLLRVVTSRQNRTKFKSCLCDFLNSFNVPAETKISSSYHIYVTVCAFPVNRIEDLSYP